MSPDCLPEEDDHALLDVDDSLSHDDCSNLSQGMRFPAGTPDFTGSVTQGVTVNIKIQLVHLVLGSAGLLPSTRASFSFGMSMSYLSDTISKCW